MDRGLVSRLHKRESIKVNARGISDTQTCSKFKFAHRLAHGLCSRGRLRHRARYSALEETMQRSGEALQQRRVLRLCLDGDHRRETCARKGGLQGSLLVGVVRRENHLWCLRRRGSDQHHRGLADQSRRLICCLCGRRRGKRRCNGGCWSGCEDWSGSRSSGRSWRRNSKELSRGRCGLDKDFSKLNGRMDEQ